MDFVNKNGLYALVYDSNVPIERERLMIRLADHAQMGGHEGRKARQTKEKLEREQALQGIKDVL